MEVETQGSCGVAVVKSDKLKILGEANPSLIKAALEEEVGAEEEEKNLVFHDSNKRDERSWPAKSSTPQRRRSYIDPNSCSMDKGGSSTATDLGGVNTSGTGLGGAKISATRWDVDAKTSGTGLRNVNTSVTGLGGAKVFTTRRYVDAKTSSTDLRNGNTYVTGLGAVNTSGTGLGGTNTYASAWDNDANTSGTGFGGVNTSSTGWGSSNAYATGWVVDANTYAAGLGGAKTYATGLGYGTAGGANTYGNGANNYAYGSGWGSANTYGTGGAGVNTYRTGWGGANNRVTGSGGGNVSATGWEWDEKTSATGYCFANNTSSTACGGAKQVSEDTPFVPERGFYQPSTEATWEAYQALTTLIEAYLYRPNIPTEVMCGVADEILSVLKSKIINTPSGKKSEIERILSPIPDFAFNELVSVANQITDYYVARPCGKKDDRVVLFAPEDDFYQPKSEDSSIPYKIFLDMVNDNIGSQQPQVVQCVVAHEVLKILKNEDHEDIQKKVMLESFLEDVSDDAYNMMLFIAGQISDFPISNGAAAAAGADANLVVHQDPSQNITTRAGEDGRDSYTSDQTNEICDYGVDDNKDESRESTPDFDAFGTKSVYSSDDNKATESDDSLATTDSDEDPVPPAAEGNAPGLKLEFSSEDETLYFPDNVRLDENDVDGWMKVDFDDFFD